MHQTPSAGLCLQCRRSSDATCLRTLHADFGYQAAEHELYPPGFGPRSLPAACRSRLRSANPRAALSALLDDVLSHHSEALKHAEEDSSLEAEPSSVRVESGSISSTSVPGDAHADLPPPRYIPMSLRRRSNSELQPADKSSHVLSIDSSRSTLQGVMVVLHSLAKQENASLSAARYEADRDDELDFDPPSIISAQADSWRAFRTTLRMISASQFFWFLHPSPDDMLRRIRDVTLDEGHIGSLVGLILNLESL